MARMLCCFAYLENRDHKISFVNGLFGIDCFLFLLFQFSDVK